MTYSQQTTYGQSRTIQTSKVLCNTNSITKGGDVAVELVALEPPTILLGGRVSFDLNIPLVPFHMEEMEELQ